MRPPKTDPFTERRLLKFADDWREKTAQLPTLKDFEDNGFARAQVDLAVKGKKLRLLYVTLTTGAILKGYKVISPA